MGNRVQTLLNLNRSGTTTFSVTIPQALKKQIDAICSARNLQRNHLVAAALEDVLLEAESAGPVGDQNKELDPVGDQNKELGPVGDQNKELDPVGDQNKELGPVGDQNKELDEEPLL